MGDVVEWTLSSHGQQWPGTWAIVVIRTRPLLACEVLASHERTISPLPALDCSTDSVSGCQLSSLPENGCES